MYVSLSLSLSLSETLKISVLIKQKSYEEKSEQQILILGFLIRKEGSWGRSSLWNDALTFFFFNLAYVWIGKETFLVKDVIRR